MLTLRDEQLAAFHADEDRAWAARWLIRFRARCPAGSAGLDDDELARRLFVARQRARRWRFRLELAAHAFVALLIDHGPDCDTFPPLSRALGDDAPDSVALCLERHLTPDELALLFCDQLGSWST